MLLKSYLLKLLLLTTYFLGSIFCFSNVSLTVLL